MWAFLLHLVWAIAVSRLPRAIIVAPLLGSLPGADIPYSSKCSHINKFSLIKFHVLSLWSSSLASSPRSILVTPASPCWQVPAAPSGHSTVLFLP